MCGICGYVSGGQELEIIEKMTRTLLHRGPDAMGCWEGSGVALGHTRLAIIDLSEAGSQPMATPDGRYQLVFNGEIYNFQEIRRELEGLGHTFKSSCDTEVILVGYARWGMQVLDRLQGMFAFAVWDNEYRRLLMARDRVGIKPLFYAQLPCGLVFASEIKAIFAHPAFRPQLSFSAIDAYLALGYVPGPDTIFDGIRALMPGCWLEWDGRREGSQVTTGSYWSPSFCRDVLEASEDELIDELDARLNDAVKSHLVADVPVGAFLSGGVDSSLVAAMAQRHTSEPIHTFTIGFSGGGDERPFARTVASHIGSHHHERPAEPDLVKLLPRLISHLEQPLFDNSILPTFLVSQLAREHVKVALSGDGGDEPFAGYEWTRYALALPHLPIPSWGVLKGWKWAYETGFPGQLKRLIHDVGHLEEASYLRRITVSQSLRHWLYTPSFAGRFVAGDPVDRMNAVLRNAPVRDKRERFLHSDLCTYLPEDVLFKVDRMSMANSLEVRVPLLDHRLLEWVLRLPFHMRFRQGRGKYLLRKVASRYLPPSILKPRKQGFTIPVGRWLHGELGNSVQALFTSRAFVERGIILPQRALALLAMHRSGRFDLGHRIWSLVILELWAQIWLDQNPPGLMPIFL